MDRLIQTDGLREHSGSKKGRPTSKDEEKTKTCRGHREQAGGGQTQRTGKRWTDTQIAGLTDRKKKQRNR